MDPPSQNPGQKQLSCPSPGHPRQSWRLRTGGRLCSYKQETQQVPLSPSP